ncbi:MAG: tetratricopeptide repeat protein [Pyrinomonadaceae bacterium]
MISSKQFVELDPRSTAGRVAVGAAVLIVLLLTFYGVRWQLGNMLAELTRPNDPRARETADAAVGLSPYDPLTRWLRAATERSVFTPEGIDNSVALLETVVRLSPYDYRWWIELGRAYEQAEKFDKAEQAFRRGVELAPSYTFPRWQLGNFLLRRDRGDEAFAEFKRATEKNLTYREQVFSLAWDYFDKDPSRLEQVISNEADVRASLALFYAARERAADSLRVWNTLTNDEKAEHPQTARTIARALTEKRFFRQGLEFSRQVGIDTDAQPETVTNGGFEKAIGTEEANFYGWNIVRGDNKLDVSSDTSVKHTGARSLKLNFRVYVKPELHNVWQIVAVEPGRSYRLSFWVRTDNLRSSGVPQVDVVNGNDNLILASSGPVPTGSVDWQEMTIDFRTPENCEGIVIRTSRVFCGEACPIAGTLWYDDFQLSRR